MHPSSNPVDENCGILPAILSMGVVGAKGCHAWPQNSLFTITHAQGSMMTSLCHKHFPRLTTSSFVERKVHIAWPLLKTMYQLKASRMFAATRGKDSEVVSTSSTLAIREDEMCICQWHHQRPSAEDSVYQAGNRIELSTK